MAGHTPPAVIVGGSANAVAVVRSLGAAGVHVTALGREDGAARWSRYLDRFVGLGAGDGAPERWVGWLLEQAAPGTVVLPCADAAVEAVVRNRDTLERRGLVLPETTGESLAATLDKRRTFEIAAGAGVPAPLMVGIASEQDLVAAAERVGYPCVLKPAHSHLFARHFDTKMFVARDEAELRGAYARAAERGLEMALTEIVAGPDSNLRSYYAYLDGAGTPLCQLISRKLRQLPIHFGVGTSRVTDWDPETAELGLRFLRAAGVRGFGQVEFKLDDRDGRSKLIECNLRFSAATSHMHAAGFDIALFVYRHLTGGPPPPMEYRRGHRTWNPIADTKASLAYRRAGELTAGEWLRSVCRRQTFEVARRDDPMPTIRYHWVRARRRLLARLGRE